MPDPVSIEQREHDLIMAVAALEIASTVWIDARVLWGAQRPPKVDSNLTEAIRAVRRAERKLTAARRRSARAA